MEGTAARGRAGTDMEEVKGMTAAQQQLLKQQQQQQQQQIMFLLHRQKQHESMMSRFPSNIDAHLRPQQHLLHRSQSPNSSPTPNPNPNPNSQVPLPNSNHQNTNPNATAATANPTATAPNNNNNGSSSSNLNSQQQQQKASRANPVELQLAYQDAWRVCHPDFRRPFSSLEDACERLLPYHVVADYEAEEDDKILDSDTSGQMLSRSQQWDHNIAAKVAEFTATFEKQVLAFNIISHKRDLGDFRTEEKLMIEQLLLQEERRSLLELRAQLDARQKAAAGRETHDSNLRMAAAMLHNEQSHSEMMMIRAPIRSSSVLGSQSSNNIPPIINNHEMSEQEQVGNQDEIMNGWGGSNNAAAQKDEKEPSDDFLNDEETENGEAAMQSEWHGGGGGPELDLNTR